jgi:hypothetical protein
VFRNCIFCKADLGTNDVIEQFPVGRKLAFDEAKGRLWAICKSCGQWNLSPLEERWEAIEECERRFRATPLRVSTEHIGLARLTEGLELVRVGTPQRPEMAAWRYGEQLGKRRRRAILFTGAAAGVGLAVIAGAQAGLFVAGGFQAVNLGVQAFNFYNNALKTAARIETDDGRRVDLLGQHVTRARTRPMEGGDWILDVPYRRLFDDLHGSRRWLLRGGFGGRSWERDPRIELRGPAAMRAVGMMLPHINRFGGSRKRVQDAVQLLEDAGSPERLFARGVGFPNQRIRFNKTSRSLRTLPHTLRLALEMAAHEETERRALLEGELLQLEQAWRDAEEIADIADNLLMPKPVTEFLKKLRS